MSLESFSIIDFGSFYAAQPVLLPYVTFLVYRLLFTFLKHFYLRLLVRWTKMSVFITFYESPTPPAVKSKLLYGFTASWSIDTIWGSHERSFFYTAPGGLLPNCIFRSPFLRRFCLPSSVFCMSHTVFMFLSNRTSSSACLAVVERLL